MIEPALLESIAEYYGHYRHDPALLMRLRDTFPQVRFTLCRDDEVVNAKPVFEGNGVNLYLVGGDHCLTLTRSFEAAMGVVVAEVDDDEVEA